MAQKDFRFELKSLSDAGSFEGLVAVYNNVDLGGDVIEPNAFAKTLTDRGNEIPILWQHDPREPIGLGKLNDTSQGLLVQGQLVLESPVAAKSYALMKAKVLRGLSIGYDSMKDRMVDGIRHLLEIKLYECSLCTFPMNPAAQITGVKSVEDFSAELRDFRELLFACHKSFRR